MKARESAKTTKKTAQAEKTKKPGVKAEKKPLQKTVTTAKSTAEKSKVKTVRKTAPKAGVKSPETPKPKAAVSKTATAKKAAISTTEKVTAIKKPLQKTVATAKSTAEKSKVKTVRKTVRKTAPKAGVKAGTKVRVKVKSVIKKKETGPLISAPKQVSGWIKISAGGKTILPVKAKESWSVKPEEITSEMLSPEEAATREVHGIPSAGLPEEYGENVVLLMVVDPDTIFASWEIKKDDYSPEKGLLNLRAYDITGIEFDGNNADTFLDMNIENRTGSGFFEIRMQGRDVMIEIGILRPDGKFMPILRSDAVSLPRLMVSDELRASGKLSDSGTPVGY
ncbi:MAG: DUF4912 domain-containing protein [Nitrospirota bacterium]|nr:DUF4912 domain-containing protein [Nitrospirota bacterium]